MPVDLVPGFVAAWERVGGTAHVVSGLPEARRAIHSIVTQAALDTAVAWDSPVLAALDLPALFRWYRTPGAPDGPESFKSACAQAGVGITTAALGTADTGSLLLPFGGTRPRSVLILPPVWIAVVPAQRLVAGRAELFAHMGALAKSGRPPTEMGLATGPSRTGDIEGILLQGIHGPGVAHAIIVEAVDVSSQNQV
ncbi:MAG TPA: LUD domain-containing protein [Symbiobacteriaceae bacterium]|jgi:L-lactate utilization protein LutC